MPGFLLLTRVDLAEVSRRSRSTSSLSDNLDVVIWGVLAVAAVWAGLYCWSRFRTKVLQSGDSPKSLLLELCRVHRLTRAERALLMQAAEAAKLAEPAVVFVNPDVLLQSGRSPESRTLAKKLFGSEITE